MVVGSCSRRATCSTAKALVSLYQASTRFHCVLLFTNTSPYPFPPRLSMEPPRLPWEVIERVIDQSSGHSATLRSFSLTCRQLRPRSRCMLFSRVEFKNKDQVFAFVDFLQGNPHIKPFVHSVVVEPTDFPPFPLLHLLSNLSEIRFARPKQYLSQGDTVSALHQSMLTCLQRFAHMDTLHISKIRFATYLPFARLLAAFPNISHLTCEEVAIQAVGGRAPLEVIRRRLFTQMRLKSLTVSVPASLCVEYLS